MRQLANRKDWARGRRGHVPSRVVNRLDEFFQTRALVLAERTRGLVATAYIDVHRHLGRLRASAGR